MFPVEQTNLLRDYFQPKILSCCLYANNYFNITPIGSGYVLQNI